jgi:hypothetical protein
LLTGGECVHFPVDVIHGSFFISEPYDERRMEREDAIVRAIEGYPYIVADHVIRNISLTCKVCQQIQSAQFGIVDVTGLNENVLIELGMLYGFNKPVIILIQKGQGIELEIPSNIIGIEQIRYENFTELNTKLENALKSLFDLWKREAEYFLDLRAILTERISYLENLIGAKKLMKAGFSSEIVGFKVISGRLVVVINKGLLHEVRNGMTFEVFLHGEEVGGEYLEESSAGYLRVFHVQERISQTYPQAKDLSHVFWRKAVAEGTLQRNIVKPFVPLNFQEIPITKIERYLKALKLVRDYSFIKE